MEESEFGVNLEKLLEESGVSITQLAKEIGVGKSTVQEWVGKGGRFPSSPKHIKSIAEFFETTTHELMFGVPDQNSLIGQILNKTLVHTGLYEISINKVDLPKRKK